MARGRLIIVLVCAALIRAARSRDALASHMLVTQTFSCGIGLGQRRGGSGKDSRRGWGHPLRRPGRLTRIGLQLFALARAAAAALGLGGLLGRRLLSRLSVFAGGGNLARGRHGRLGRGRDGDR